MYVTPKRKTTGCHSIVIICIMVGLLLSLVKLPSEELVVRDTKLWTLDAWVFFLFISFHFDALLYCSWQTRSILVRNCPTSIVFRKHVTRIHPVSNNKMTLTHDVAIIIDINFAAGWENWTRLPIWIYLLESGVLDEHVTLMTHYCLSLCVRQRPGQKGVIVCWQLTAHRSFWRLRLRPQR